MSRMGEQLIDIMNEDEPDPFMQQAMEEQEMEMWYQEMTEWWRALDGDKEYIRLHEKTARPDK